MLVKTFILFIFAWLSLFNGVYAQEQINRQANNSTDKFDKRTKCISLGEQFYSNYLKEQEHNEMFSFDVMDMNHEVAYSSKLDTCLIYIRIKFKDIPGHQGNNLNKWIFDLLNNNVLYSMAYGVDKNHNEVVLQATSSFKTDKEFMNKKEELFK